MTTTKERAKENGRKPEHEQDVPLTISEAARFFNKHPNTIKRWIMDGLLEPVRLPSGLLAVMRSQCEKFLGGSALATKAGAP